MHEDTNLTSTPPETKPGSAQRSKLGRSFDIMNQLFNSAHGHMLTVMGSSTRRTTDLPDAPRQLSAVNQQQKVPGFWGANGGLQCP